MNLATGLGEYTTEQLQAEINYRKEQGANK